MSIRTVGEDRGLFTMSTSTYGTLLYLIFLMMPIWIVSDASLRPQLLRSVPISDCPGLIIDVRLLIFEAFEVYGRGNWFHPS